MPEVVNMTTNKSAKLKRKYRNEPAKDKSAGRKIFERLQYLWNNPRDEYSYQKYGSKISQDVVPSENFVEFGFRFFFHYLVISDDVSDIATYFVEIMLP